MSVPGPDLVGEESDALQRVGEDASRSTTRAKSYLLGDHLEALSEVIGFQKLSQPDWHRFSQSKTNSGETIT